MSPQAFSIGVRLIHGHFGFQPPHSQKKSFIWSFLMERKEKVWPMLAQNQVRKDPI